MPLGGHEPKAPHLARCGRPDAPDAPDGRRTRSGRASRLIGWQGAPFGSSGKLGPWRRLLLGCLVLGLTLWCQADWGNILTKKDSQLSESGVKIKSCQSCFYHQFLLFCCLFDVVSDGLLLKPETPGRHLGCQVLSF